MQCYRPISVKGLVVPCGKCPACLANIRQEWCFRLNAEYLACSFGLFVTLTYDDAHLPADLSVNKRDVQLFLKRLRKELGNHSFRYFITAEYGDNTHRPHYHGLFFFSIPFSPKVYDQITRNWQNGFCDFGDIEPASVAYCTKYCMKQTKVPDERKPTFRLTSRRPCIGDNYLQANSAYHIETCNLSRASLPWSTARLPRLFRDKLKDNFTADYFIDRDRLAEQQARQRLEKAYNAWYRLHGKEYSSTIDADYAFAEFINGQKQRQQELLAKRIKKQKL